MIFEEDKHSTAGKSYAEIAVTIKILLLRLLLLDRKSTRLNSSHANISYAVFCLKKKNKKQQKKKKIKKIKITSLTLANTPYIYMSVTPVILLKNSRFHL